MKKRKINRIILGQDIQMGSTTLKQPLPVGDIQQVDPFLLIHHFGPKTQEPFGPEVLEVGAHPHRGFEPVTFIFKGNIHHRDSRGNDSIIGEGGVQWMTAGMGIVHSEGVSRNFLEQGGELEIIQLWINLPSKQKMIQPRYQGFQREEIPAFEDQEGKVRVNVMAGEFQELQGPVESITGVNAYTLEIKAGGTLRLAEPPSRQVLLYQLSGISQINDIDSNQHKLVMFKDEGEEIEIVVQEDSVFLFLSGVPIGEPVAQYGPFVMNNQTEVLQAMRDYQIGKMGVLI